MIRRTGMSRRTPLERTSGLLPYRRRHRSCGPTKTHSEPLTDWKALRAVLWERCGAYCEACGQRLNDLWWDAHHRLLRSAGGADTPDNLLALHPSCHTVQPHSVHMRPQWSYERGLLVHSWADPGLVPLLLPDRRLVLLTADGHYAAPDHRGHPVPPGVTPVPNPTEEIA